MYKYSFLLILLVACAQENELVKVEFSKTEKNIPITSDYFGQIYKPVVQPTDSSLLVFSIDRNSNAIELFDLDNTRPIKRITLDYDGPNGIGGTLQEIFPINKDSIWVLSDYDLSLINETGEIRSKIDIYNNSNFPDYFLHPKGTLGRYNIYFDRHKNKIYGRFINKNITREEVKYYDEPIEGFISLEDTTYYPLDITYPEIYHQEYQYGVLSYVSRTVANDDVFIYTYHVDPSIYLYQMKSAELIKKEFEGFPSPKGLLRDQVDQMDLLENLLENYVYLEVLYDPFRNLYYQFILGETEVKQSNGNYTDPGKKPIYLRIFNDNFTNYGIIDLSYKTYLPVNCFVTEEGLWINKETSFNKENVENLIQYDVYDFSTIE